MERKIDNSISFLDVTIPYFFHAEIFIRILRKHIKDISFLHFIRIFLHKKETFTISNIENFFLNKKNKFFCFLWNLYIHEFEYFLKDVFTKSYEFETKIFWNFIDGRNSIEKLDDILGVSKRSTDKSLLDGIKSNHYIRYQNNFTIILNNENILILQKWTILFILVRQKYFNIWFDPSRFSIKDLFKKKIFFLGYMLRLQKKTLLIKIKIKSYFTNIDLIQKEVCSIIPTISLIRFSTKEKFCDITGRPLCKPSWTTLPDNEIFKRFNQIILNIYHYYSGCSNKKGLYQLQYIFRFSCAKTLACKHKSTIRTVWKKYGLIFFKNPFFFEKPQSISLKIWKARPYKKNFWYFNIIQINYFAYSLQKSKFLVE
uniref:Maturase K n=1 Tax=Cyathodium smaragdinum TaxID=2846787 RepID=A0A8F2XV96_9MARC|nr:maturase K [Cyathodium smaragdinum]